MENPSRRSAAQAGTGQGLPSGTVTFLFTDIEGSTKLAQQHRAQWESLRARHHAILHQAMEAHQGHVFQTIGDAFCVAFHTAADALEAAVDAQSLLQQEAWSPAPLKVRMGIHTGTAHAASDGDGSYRGYTSLARAQRLMSAGHGGQVLISLSAQQLVREDLPQGVTLRDMGEKRLKDLVLPERIYQLVVPELPADFPPIKTLDAYRHNLPAQLTSFIGREQELAQVAQAIGKHRLVTLTGPGGTGKTRLALQAAADLLDEFPDGVWIMELAPLSDPALVPSTLLAALGLREQTDRSALQTALQYARERNLLLVLDNCEHLLEACAGLAQALLDQAPGVKIIATSREGLGVRGEATWPLHSLTLPDLQHLPAPDRMHEYESVRLFAERASLVQPDFAITASNVSAVAHICSRLDGIPLALELAAARVKVLSPQNIAARLDDRFNLLTGGSKLGLERHQTLRGAIDWSYNLLSEAEQDMLQRLSVFAGGWSLEGAKAMATRVEPPRDNWLDLLASLVDKSLVAHDPETGRYSMLETMRQYGLEKVATGGRTASFEMVHQRHFLEVAEEFYSSPVTVGLLIAPPELKAELDNLRLALDGLIRAGMTDEAQQFAGDLMWFWGSGTTFEEARSWLERALGMTGPSAPRYRARGLRALAEVHWARGESEAAEALAVEALELSRAGGDSDELSRSLLAAAFTTFAAGKNAEARALAEDALAILRGYKQRLSMLATLSILGDIAIADGDLVAAEDRFREGLSIAREEGDERHTAIPLFNLGNVAYARGNWAEARSCYEQANASWVRARDKWVEAMSMSGLANVLCREGQSDYSARIQGYVDRLLREVGGGLQPVERACYLDTTQALKAHLGEEGYQRAFEQGKALAQEQAIEMALNKV